MLIRAAADGDTAAIAAIAAANDDHGAGDDPRYVAHLRAYGAFWVADDAGTVAGYCATRRVGAATMLCDLFIAPGRQGRGVGRLLLGRAFAEPGERFTFASQDPRALPLYISYGMAPRWPLLYLTGPPVPAGPGLYARAVPASEAVAAARHLPGPDRGADLAFLASGPGGHGIVVRRDGPAGTHGGTHGGGGGDPERGGAERGGERGVDGGAVVAAGVGGTDGIRHLRVAGGVDAGAVVAAATRVFGRALALCLPGAHPAVPALLAAGWRVTAFDHHMSSSPGLVAETGVLSPSLC